MKTSDMSIAQLWKAHWANPNDQPIRSAIALRDPRAIRQLQPITGRCVVSEAEGRIDELQAVADQEIADLEEKLDDAPNEDDYADMERQVEDLEDKVESLEREAEDLKAQLAAK